MSVIWWSELDVVEYSEHDSEFPLSRCFIRVRPTFHPENRACLRGFEMAGSVTRSGGRELPLLSTALSSVVVVIVWRQAARSRETPLIRRKRLSEMFDARREKYCRVNMSPHDRLVLCPISL